jgi:hypothetical protein
MRLSELEPQFLAWDDDKHFHHVPTLTEADGIIFVCPKCLHEKGTRPGVHSVICWEPNVPQTTSPIPGRWEMQGTGFEDLTLVAGSSSIFLTGPGCGAHFWIRNGEIAEGNW